jgi:hypothetical protein
MTPEQKKAAYLVQNGFINYRRSIINIWRDFDFIQQTVGDFKSKVVAKTIPSLKIKNHNDNGFKEFHANDINGICDRLLFSTNAKKALINSVSLTENYLQTLGETIYKTYPEKINSKDSVEVIGQQVKLMQVIMDSATKEEILDKLIEEKLRGIFYGNPIDFFEKDKGKLGFGTTFKDTYSKALTHYAEVINRRNINIHNQGMVDRKYIRETGSTLKLGTKPRIDETYLKNAIMLLLGMAGMATKLVLERTLAATYYHKFIHSAYKRFEKDYK